MCKMFSLVPSKKTDSLHCCDPKHFILFLLSNMYLHLNQRCSVSKETPDVCNSHQRDGLVQQSIITLALLHELFMNLGEITLVLFRTEQL